MTLLPYAVAALILCLGIGGIVYARSMIGQVICLAVAQSSTYVLLLAVGFRHGGGAPIFFSTGPGAKTAVDPIVQTLALTDIVVSAATTALLLALVGGIAEDGHSLDPDQPKEQS